MGTGTLLVISAASIMSHCGPEARPRGCDVAPAFLSFFFAFVRNWQAGGVSPEGNAYCAVGRPRSALWSAAISRNGRGSQDRRPRVITLVCQSPPYVGRGGKLACPRTTAPVFSQTDHQRDRRAPPRGARRATSAAGRWGPLQSRNASLTLPTLAPLAPRRCTARANAPPPPVEQRVVPPCCLARPAPAPTSCRV